MDTNKKFLVGFLVLVGVLALAYWLVTSYKPAQVVSPEESQLSDVDFLLDNSANNEINNTLNDVLLSSALDSQALAEEASQLDLLAGNKSPAEINQYLQEVSQ